MSEVRQLAIAVDTAIEALESAVHAYVDAALELNAAHILERNQPHPRLERAGDFVRAAAASKHRLRRYLDLTPANPPITVAQNHPE